ncbi:cation-transporting ATPase [Spiroplasma helicoides]|uniref:Cation-transporting ATPase n=1 Tax=Spiroplasma helicoides TaxID=216938 RepID=A0A1B3SKP0_9MOLU|nr:cation-translocating P-type ATPase [Spiroplasma helicoides]AOG60487.1 cation-transporting ATPase [Spiroplasma helicoides]
MDEYLSKDNKQLQAALETDIKKGLTDAQVKEKTEKYGKNALPQGKVTPWYMVFLHSLFEPIQIILMIAAIISVLAPLLGKGEWTVTIDDFIDFIVIFLIVIIDAILETVQTIKARKSMDALKDLSKPKAVVIRNNMQQEIDATELVPGDIVVLEAGKYVPAELRIVESSELMIDESILTGESVPVEKTHKPIKSTTILADMQNIAFMSTFTTAGRAIGVVIKTGENTEIGKIATSINKNDEEATPLEKKLSQFTLIVALVSLALGIIIFISLYFSGNSTAWASYLMVAITLAIGVIPECLAAIISITLSFSARRLAHQNVIVKKLKAVETLGSVNVICTDKTGTLTQNKMTVTKLVMDNRVINAKDYTNEKHDEHLDYFLKALVLCNDSVTENDERIGDPTELALVDFAEVTGLDEQKARDEFIRIDEKPFDSERKMMTTVNDIKGVKTVFTKGAIDQLLQCCSKIMIDNVTRPITQEDKDELLKIAGELSENALRVLAFAYKETGNEGNKSNFESDLVFLGAVAMIDPVRDSAVQAIKQAKAAGVKVVMITGDHAVTALAIARDLDLAHDEKEVMNSKMLDTMSDEDFLEIIEQIRVFARVNPEHKVRIVDALQKRHNITSMTGDGVNDAPSLAKADIGVAMGITGTDVAKQASDVILTDDNFETIIKGVNEGRNVYAKIKRAITFILGVNFSNVLAIFILSLINSVSPLEATNILWMNLIVESCIALAIGMGKNDDSLMKVKPIKGKNSLFRGIWFSMGKIIVFLTICSIGAFYFGMSFVDKDHIMNIFNDETYRKILESHGYNDESINALAESGWYQIFKNHDVPMEIKLEIGDYGRTAIFMLITCAPSFFVNFIKLSQWKTSKKINMVTNKPLIVSSLIAAGLNMIALFVPGINNNILNLLNTKEYFDHWYMIPVILCLTITPTIAMLLTDGIVFVSYHYFPDPRRRNKQLLDSMIFEDKKLLAQKRAIEKQKRDKENQQ